MTPHGAPRDVHRRRVRPFDPEDVRLPDIAGGLTHTCRFGGHCRRFHSVAHHSPHAGSELADRGPRLELLGQLHDAGEAYIGDLARPVKAEFEAVEQAEARIRRAVWTAFDLEPPDESERDAVMAADDRLLVYEANELLADGARAADPQALDYDLRSDDVADVRERLRSGTGGSRPTGRLRRATSTPNCRPRDPWV